MTFHLEIAPEGPCALRFSRFFAAPRPLVWRAFTEPGLLTQWLWTEDHRMTHCEQDFREGGNLRWCWAMTGGGSMGLAGRFVEIIAPEKLVHTEVFDDDWTGGETTLTTHFREVEGGTMMEIVALYASPEARDRVASSPLAAAMEEGYARLTNLLPGWSSCAA